MTAILEKLAEVVGAANTPVTLLALIALLVSFLAYFFFRNEHVYIKLCVFVTVFLGAFLVGVFLTGPGGPGDDCSLPWKQQKDIEYCYNKQEPRGK